MQYAQLGKTDLKVSRICFGCWQLSPAWWGKVPLEPWEKAVVAALDVGVNFIDTADAYGDGGAETALGNLLAREKLRDRFVLATKFYWNFEQAERHPDTSPAYIRRACEASLRRLKTDRIDLYQIHAFDPLSRPDETAAALLQLKQQGKIRWIGVSNMNPEQIRMYGRHFGIACLQPKYNLLEREAEAQVFPYCLAEGIAAIVYSPLCRGLLTGKYARDATFADSRAKLHFFQPPEFARILDALDSLRPLAERNGLTVAQLAIRWILTHPAVTCAIVGVKTREHIAGIAAAADGALAPDEWHRVAGVMERARSVAG